MDGFWIVTMLHRIAFRNLPTVKLLMTSCRRTAHVLCSTSCSRLAFKASKVTAWSEQDWGSALGQPELHAGCKLAYRRSAAQVRLYRELAVRLRPGWMPSRPPRGLSLKVPETCWLARHHRTTR